MGGEDVCKVILAVVVAALKHITFYEVKIKY